MNCLLLVSLSSHLKELFTLKLCHGSWIRSSNTLRRTRPSTLEPRLLYLMDSMQLRMSTLKPSGAERRPKRKLRKIRLKLKRGIRSGNKKGVLPGKRRKRMKPLRSGRTRFKIRSSTMVLSRKFVPRILLMSLVTIRVLRLFQLLVVTFCRFTMLSRSLRRCSQMDWRSTLRRGLSKMLPKTKIMTTS